MKRKGFTLIELLAVIVVLAIIALIATPIVLNIINSAKESSNKRSGELYIKAVENAIMKKQMNGTTTVDLNTKYVVDKNGNICKSTCYENSSDSEKTAFVCPTNDTIEIDVDGDKPALGSTITLGSKGVVTEYNMTISGTSIVKEDGSGDEDEEEAVTVAGATFSDGVTLTWQQLIDGVDKDKYGYNNDYITETEIKDTNIVSDEELYGAFVMCSSLESITLPSTVTKIGYGTFGGSGLTSITIPSSVTSIGEYAFQSSSLTSVIIPSSVETISDAAFSSCENLTNITIPSSVTSIGDCSFSDCTSLTSITIPSSILTIKAEAFANCTNLLKITYNGTDYTSKSALTSALTNNGVDWRDFLGDTSFSD